MNVASAMSFVWDTKPDFPSDMIMKSNERKGHIVNLTKFLERIKEYKLRLNFTKMHLWGNHGEVVRLLGK